MFPKEQIQVLENWQENVVTALSDPTALGISNINEMFLPQVAVVPDLHSNTNSAENIQNTQVSVDRHIATKTLMTIITQITVMMSGAK